MKIYILKENDINKLVADEIVNSINNNSSLILGLATGSTPLGVYSNLVNAYKSGKVSFKNVTTFNLDEYVGLSKEDPNTYRNFMNKNLFNQIDINLNNTHMPEDLNYDNEIDKSGGIDIQLLGIGRNGHIAFNEPLSSFQSKTHYQKLTNETMSDNARFFGSISDVPTEAITMGLGSIMKSKKIILIALGKNKAQAVKNMIEGKVDISCPASILRQHQNVSVFIDDAAASLLTNK